jgi:hypothetical protein
MNNQVKQFIKFLYYPNIFFPNYNEIINFTRKTKYEEWNSLLILVEKSLIYIKNKKTNNKK